MSPDNAKDTGPHFEGLEMSDDNAKETAENGSGESICYAESSYFVEPINGLTPAKGDGWLFGDLHLERSEYIPVYDNWWRWLTRRPSSYRVSRHFTYRPPDSA